MIKASHITKYYGSYKALDDFSFNVPKGAVYGLVGPNGAGKTTIINHIIGVLKQDAGQITIDGEKVYENAALKQRVLNIADDWFFYNSYTVQDTMKFYKGMYKSFNTERYESMISSFGFSPKQNIRSMSKGMKKQVAFIMALSCMPDVLVLDEPLDGLDPVMRKAILKFLINDVSEREMTVLVSSHNLRELEDICDYVGIMYNGKMLIEKPLDDIKGSIIKYQIAFKDGMPEELLRELNVMHDEALGIIHTIIVKGDYDKIQETINKYNPLVAEHIKLTLEEVFIYELGGMGYDFKEINI